MAVKIGIMNEILSPELLQRIGALALSATMVMGSPGPSTMSAMAVTAAFGARQAAAYVLGLVVGTAAVLIVVALGLFTVVSTVPWLNSMIAWAGTVYVLYLAFRIATAPALEGDCHERSPPSFAAATLLAVSNPKAYLAIASVFGGTTLLAVPKSDAFLKVLLLALLIVVIHLTWMVGGGGLANRLRSPSVMRRMNMLMGILLAISAVVPYLR